MRCAILSFRSPQIRVSQAEQSLKTLCIVCQMQISEQRFQSRGTAILGNGGPLRHVGVYRIACTAIDGLLLLRQVGKDPFHRIALGGGGYVGKRSFAGMGCLCEHQLTANHYLQNRIAQIGKLCGGIGNRPLIIVCFHIHTISIASEGTFCKTGGKKVIISFGVSEAGSLTLPGMCAIIIR